MDNDLDIQIKEITNSIQVNLAVVAPNLVRRSCLWARTDPAPKQSDFRRSRQFYSF